MKYKASFTHFCKIYRHYSSSGGGGGGGGSSSSRKEVKLVKCKQLYTEYFSLLHTKQHGLYLTYKAVHKVQACVNLNKT